MEQRLVDADRLSRMGEMAGEIGHELNNYLMAIGGRAELALLALDRGNPQKARHSAELIAEQVSEMRKLTDGLLDSAKTERSPIHMDLNELVQASVEFIRPQNKFDGIKLHVSLAAGPISVFADPQQVRQILLNLLVNGADAITEHRGRQGGEIRIETFSAEDEGGFLVADTGGGIDDETRSRIFEPHFTTKDTGHGFGLAVCHRVVTNHGGRIAVESSPGSGATFAVHLPLAEATDPARATSRQG
jgi:signal transduction histidine kinase